MAEVYRAVDLYHSGQTVALKLFTAANVEEDIVAESFKRETLALKELKHESIVELLDAGTDRDTGRYFIVLEWIEGDLSDWLTTSSLKEWDSFYATIGQDVLRASSVCPQPQCYSPRPQDKKYPYRREQPCEAHRLWNRRN